jgi:hypothetical protein
VEVVNAVEVVVREAAISNTAAEVIGTDSGAETSTMPCRERSATKTGMGQAGTSQTASAPEATVQATAVAGEE